MPDSNLNTSIAAMRTSILNSAATATADELVDLSRSAKSLNLIEDSAVEVAINNRSLSLLNAGASHEEMIKISKAVKSILSSTATTTNITNETTFGASIIPDADISYDLGSATNRFRDVYLDGSTINLAAQTIKSSASSIEVEELTIGSGVNKVKLGATLDGKLERTGTDSNGVTDVPRTATPGTVVVVNFSDLLSITSPTAGQSVLVTSTNKIYINNGSGWYQIGDVTNASPVGITDVNASYNSSIGGSPIVITAVSTDPEADTLTWSYFLTSGSLNGTTVTNVDNVFTITPHATQIATFELSIGVSDSINSTVSTVTTITIDNGNTGPDAITGVNSTYPLDVGAAAQTITAISSDPQGDSLTWSHTTSGSLNGTTVTNVDNVFTITPHSSQASNFNVVISVSDGEYQVDTTTNVIVSNDTLSTITGYSGPYTLATDSTPTTLTLGGGIDPEGQSVTWSHSVNSGTLNGTTVTNVDNVFTITPHSANSTTFTIIISATDGVNSTSTASITFTLTHVATPTVLATFTNPNATTDIGGADNFGSIVQLTSNNVVIHAGGEDGPSATLHNNSGRAYIYNKNSPYSLQRNILNPSAYGTEDTSGNGVGTHSAANHNGDLIYVGNRMKDSSTTSWVGEAYSYRVTTGATTTRSSPTTTLDMFGDSIDCSHTNNKVLIGSSYYGNYSGRMYLYNANSTTGSMSLSATYPNQDGNGNSYFAADCAISHDGYYVAAGQASWPGYGINGYSTGKVWVFNNTSTSLHVAIPAPYFNTDNSGYADPNFGRNIHFISDDKLLVCAARYSTSQTVSYSVFRVYTISSGGYSTAHTVTLPSGETTPYTNGIASSNGYYAIALTTRVQIHNIAGSLIHTINEAVSDVDMTVSGTTATVITGVSNGTCKLWTIPL